MISPCVKICKIASNGYCEGCNRSLTEIANWVKYTHEQRAEIMSQLKDRDESIRA